MDSCTIHEEELMVSSRLGPLTCSLNSHTIRSLSLCFVISEFLGVMITTQAVIMSNVFVKLPLKLTFNYCYVLKF